MLKKSETQSLEIYLAQIEHELRDLPVSARVDELREIGSHLGALVQAGQQLEDISNDEALAAALRQFGEPRAIGRNLRQAWERKQPEAWWRAGLSLSFALGFFTVVVLPFMLGFQNFYLNYHGVNAAIPTANTQIAGIYETMAMRCQFIGFFFMIFATYIMGLISPKRSKWVISTLVIYLIVPTLFANYPHISQDVLILDANLIVAALGGTYFGDRYGRRLISRIADCRENIVANRIL